MKKILLFLIICFSSSLDAKQTNEEMKEAVSGQKLKYLLSIPEGKPDENGWITNKTFRKSIAIGIDNQVYNIFPTSLKRALTSGPQCKCT